MFEVFRDSWSFFPCVLLLQSSARFQIFRRSRKHVALMIDHSGSGAGDENVTPSPWADHEAAVLWSIMSVRKNRCPCRLSGSLRFIEFYLWMREFIKARLTGPRKTLWVKVSISLLLGFYCLILCGSCSAQVAYLLVSVLMLMPTH